SELARRLRGKHKPVFTPHVDTGDYLIVINAEKVAVTGKKLQDKMYHRLTGYVGNLKSENLAQALERHAERVIEIAAKRMLPNIRTPPSSRSRSRSKGKSWQPLRITAPAVASRPPRAFSCARAAATSPSTIARSRTSSAARPRA